MEDPEELRLYIATAPRVVSIAKSNFLRLSVVRFDRSFFFFFFFSTAIKIEDEINQVTRR